MERSLSDSAFSHNAILARVLSKSHFCKAILITELNQAILRKSAL